ncbi:MAG: 50S ribosomal protein L3 [Candidatus Parcubacteria bacterium]|nr:50S ribosomal protein L3 [Candidatus Parcubacteria bacterium]
MKSIFATKEKMTQVFDKDGNVIPGTLVRPKNETDISVFEEGEKVVISGTTKGKGFQGVVKRHGFHGGPRTHGQKHSEREPGSIGSAGVQRVFRGTRMAGRMGGKRKTIKNLKIVEINKEKNQILISGAVPGRYGTLLEIYGG